MGQITQAVVNPKTAQQTEAFLHKPSQGLVLLGANGAGKKYLATQIACQLLNYEPERIDNHPYYFPIAVQDGKSEISIDATRELIKKLSLRVIDQTELKNSVNRVAIIENAELLSTEAQNAILKLLEEPPTGSLIILTATVDKDLLPTVVSRVQKLPVLPISLNHAFQYFGEQYSKSDIENAWQLSNGLVGTMFALLAGDNQHPIKLAIAQAKEFISLSSYQRVIFLQTKAKNKAELKNFLEALLKVMKALHEVAIKRSSCSNSAKLLETRIMVSSLINSSELNTNPRLIALSLAVDIPL